MVQPYHANYLFAWGMSDINALEFNNDIIHFDVSCMCWKACIYTPN